MRAYIALFTTLLAGSLFAQVAARKEPASSKEIMTTMTIPSSNALFGVSEKPTSQEWAELRKQAQTLTESANLLLIPGRVKSKANNPPDWNLAATSLRDAAKSALIAIDKRNAELLAGDVADKILGSCSACHEKYLPK